jgi:uncharacterized protein YcfJ
MNHKYLFIAALALGMAPTVYAQTYTDSARVMGVEPQYSNVRNTRRECTQEWVTVQSPPQQAPQSRNYGGAIVGGLVGGVIGHQFGGGQGKDLATAAGVTLGAIAGDQHTNGGSYTSAPQPEQRQVERCYNVNEAQPQVTGYHVTYEYRGQLYSVLMRNRPSEVINVRVTVNPID